MGLAGLLLLFPGIARASNFGLRVDLVFSLPFALFFFLLIGALTWGMTWKWKRTHARAFVQALGLALLFAPTFHSDGMPLPVSIGVLDLGYAVIDWTSFSVGTTFGSAGLATIVLWPILLRRQKKQRA